MSLVNDFNKDINHCCFFVICDTVIVNYGIRHVGTQTSQQYVIMSIVTKAEIFYGSVSIQWI